MPQVSTVVLSDGTNAHSFTPVNVQPQGVSLLADRSLGVKDLESTLTVSSRSSGSGAHNVKLKLTLPKIVTDSTTGVSEATDSAIADISFRFPGASTEAERVALVTMVSNALSADQTVLYALSKDMESIW